MRSLTSRAVISGDSRGINRVVTVSIQGDEEASYRAIASDGKRGSCLTRLTWRRDKRDSVKPDHRRIVPEERWRSIVWIGVGMVGWPVRVTERTWIDQTRFTVVG